MPSNTTIRSALLAWLILLARVLNATASEASPKEHQLPAIEYQALLPYKGNPLYDGGPYTSSVSEDYLVEPIYDEQLDRLHLRHGYENPNSPWLSSTEFVEPVSFDSATYDAQQLWHVQLLPADVVWHSYAAGVKEPRISGVMFYETSADAFLLDVSLGGRTAIVRLDSGPAPMREVWELQVEGAGMLRLNLKEHWDFDAADFRFGVPLIYAQEYLHWKFAYYHVSSHLGDEFITRTGSFVERINYSRDVLVLGASLYPMPAWRWYAEVGWAFYTDGGSEPFELQFGFEYAQPGPTGPRGTPFLAANGQLREEVHFGGNFVLQTGWLWRGNRGRTLRTGFHYYNGKSSQYQFYNDFEQQLGFGIWQDY